MHGTLGHARRLFLTTDAVGGVWRYSLAIASGFAAQGWHCTIATMGPAPDIMQRAEVDAIQRCKLINTGLPLDWTAEEPAELAAAAETLQAIARKCSATNVHLHTPALAAFKWPIPAAAVAHSCVGTWWHALHDVPAPPHFRWRMSLMEQGLRKAAAIVAPSNAVARALQATYNVCRRIDVVHNGLEPARLHNAARSRRILTAARLWDRGKNIAVLDKAAALLNSPIDAAGPAIGPDGTRFAAKHLRLLGNLPASDLRHVMSRAAAFAAPSLYEPFGLAVLEAAQLATPLVLADNATFRELWHGAALFADPNDPEAWAACFRTLLPASASAAQYGQKALARSRQYTARSMVAATLSIHQTIALEVA